VSGGSGSTVEQPPLSIAAAQTSDGVRLELSGELDLASEAEFKRALDDAVRTRPAGIVLDLSDLSFLDSCGLRSLLEAQRRCEQLGCALTLIAGDPARRLFELTGVAERLPLVEPPAGREPREAEAQR
jgi:anti-sigma B factor antagonist